MREIRKYLVMNSRSFAPAFALLAVFGLAGCQSNSSKPSSAVITCGCFKPGDHLDLRHLRQLFDEKGLIVGAVSFDFVSTKATIAHIEEVDPMHVKSLEFMTKKHTNAGQILVENGIVTQVICDNDDHTSRTIN